MGTVAEKNERIAKNTFFLYLRMAFSMVVALYTTRAVLNALGEDDYGIYGVVGGIVLFFYVVSGSMNAAISRFLTFEIGKGKIERLNRIFCTSVNIQLLMSLIFVIVAEVVGVWFLNVKMNIPEGRMYAAHWVLQCSIMSFVVGLISIPYNATIIAHEHMGAFAYLGITSTLLNLGVAIVIGFVGFDRLVFYAFAILGINVLMRFIYAIYCKKHFVETKWRLTYDKSIMREMGGFAGWNFIGASSGVLLNQGVNILMNLFFGVAVNAAKTVASNVSSAIGMLVGNFTTALNPQITKSYAMGDLDYMHSIICRGAKFSYFIMFIPALPILLETNQILTIWLKQVPEYTIVFTRLTVLISLNAVLSQTLITSMLATGNIKKYQIIVGGLNLSVFPLAYIAYKLGYPPYASYVIQFVIYGVELAARMVLLKGMVKLPIRKYVNEVLLSITIVTIIAATLPMIMMMTMRENLIRLLSISAVSVLCTFLSIYVLGLSSGERIWVKGKIKVVLKKFGSK